jgi:hypothetical protein
VDASATERELACLAHISHGSVPNYIGWLVENVPDDFALLPGARDNVLRREFLDDHRLAEWETACTRAPLVKYTPPRWRMVCELMAVIFRREPVPSFGKMEERAGLGEEDGWLSDQDWLYALKQAGAPDFDATGDRLRTKAPSSEWPVAVVLLLLPPGVPHPSDETLAISAHLERSTFGKYRRYLHERFGDLF